VTRPEADQRLEQTRRDGVLVDGFVAPVGEREHYHGPFSGKKHVSGQNVQVIADLDGRVTDVGEPVNGARHDAAAFYISGIAERWASHLARGGPGMIGDGGTRAPDRSPAGSPRAVQPEAPRPSQGRDMTG
jgi:hypothetical protein